ncbi:hypothetical protein C8R43DRAFT_1004914 [Mycena crocata]|nr:hypothetical protein C8R43DRAFT_1004914 [Mycena crocata]
MYPRASPTYPTATGSGGHSTVGRGARSLRDEEDKENNASPRGSARRDKVRPSRRREPHTVRRALAAANTAVIGDTLDFPTVSVHDLGGTALTPANLLAGVEVKENDDVQFHVWVAARRAVEEHKSRYVDDNLILRAMERLVLELGVAMDFRNGGPQFIFVDPRWNDDAAEMVRSARRLVGLFRLRGVHKKDLVISIPATEDGVAAAQELESEHDIRTNLILVAGLIHAAVCAEAGATTIVGPLLLCHERERNAIYQDLAMHPGIEIIQATQTYFALHEIRTKLVGRDFRQLAELSALTGFDAVCLSNEQLEVARWRPETRSPDLPNYGTLQAASMRARQAQYPTKFLEKEKGFMEQMSPQVRRMVAASMFPALEKMEQQMNAIEKIVKDEVAWQLALKTMALDALYEWQWNAPPAGPPAKAKQNRESYQVAARRPEKRRKPLGDACERENEGGLIEGVEYF